MLRRPFERASWPLRASPLEDLKMSNVTNVFISYAHQDRIIAYEIRNQLTLLAQHGKGGPCVECFLDTESILPGQKYGPVIMAALQEADWLIVVFTGDQSSYCGYEIGMYSAMKAQQGLSAPIVCLHDVDQSKIPAMIEEYKTTLISAAAAYLPDGPLQFTNDEQLWWKSEICQVLTTICSAKKLYVPDDRQSNPVQYQVDLAQASSRICQAFETARQEDEVWETPVQAGFELTIYPPFGGVGARIPNASIVIGSSRAFDILGLIPPLQLEAKAQAPQITWGELRQKLAPPGSTNIPWMDKLEANIGLAADLKVPETDDVTFRGSQGNRIYRAILTRHKLFKNGKRRFYVLLVETFDRRFIGDRETSMLLIALTLASRWRFTFFERWSDYLKQFDPSRTDKDFQIACKQLEYNMEWIENEGLELGADNQDAMVEAFGQEKKARIQSYYNDFYEAKAKMKSHLPETFVELKPQARAEARNAIVEFLTFVKSQNADFLRLCVDTYAAKIHASRD
jgi:hypothetical protein